MSDKGARQFEQYWRKKISDELYAEHQQALSDGQDWRAIWFAVASGFVLGDLRIDTRQPIRNSDYRTDIPGRPG